MLSLLLLQIMQQNNKLSLTLRREAALIHIHMFATYTCVRSNTHAYVCIYVCVCACCFLRAHLNF